jgi:hypothetical protein
MRGYEPSLASEELAGLLQDLPSGAHIAVTLRGLELRTAFEVSRQAAAERGQHLLVVGDRQKVAAETVADSLGAAIGVTDLVSPGRHTLLVVDAQASVERAGAKAHAEAEELLSRVPARLTVICFYTEEALAAVTPAKVDHLHALVAAPGQV